MLSNFLVFQNDEIFIQLDEWDRIAHIWIEFNDSLTEA